MTDAPKFNILPFGENGWIVQFTTVTDNLASALYANHIAEGLRGSENITDAVAGIDSVTIRFDPTKTRAKAILHTLHHALQNSPFEAAPPPAKTIDIPVCYSGEFGPDFEDLCAQNNLTPAQLIEAHSSRTYRVLMLGFAPGFAYLGPLDPVLTTPRLTTPRAYVAAGSIGVADAFAGVYSTPSPGGWRIIGRTPMRLFDPAAATPFIFEAGVEVRFTPVDAEIFKTQIA